jgi:hypothetical protein
MDSPISFTRFAYFDTNIYSHLAKNISLWNPLLKFLLNYDLSNSFSSANLAELADATFLYNSLTNLMLCMPTGVIKTWDMILDEEIASHPNKRVETLLLDPIIRLAVKKTGHEELKSMFTSKKLSFAREEQLRYAKQMKITHSSYKQNFPPASSGKYIRQQADEFADISVLQWLSSTHLKFLKKFKNNATELNTKAFQSVRIFGLVNFYKYYLGNRNINKLSDFGDFAHLCYLPYCNLVIIEKDLCNILNQIKNNHDILQKTTIRNIDFFKDWNFVNK